MKFGKEFVEQMIPEWQQAYIDYACLKTILQEIQTSRKRSEGSSGALRRKQPVGRNFSGLTKRYSRTASSQDLENQDIMVNVTTGDDGFERYETTIMKISEAGRESELVFFKTLDLEFDKVNRFYRSKVEEMVKEAVVLNKQMDVLIAFRIKVDQPSSSWTCTETVSVDMNDLDSREQSKFSERLFVCYWVSYERTQSLNLFCGLCVFDFEGKTLAEEMGIKLEENRSNREDSTKESVPEALSVLDRIRLNRTQESPLSTIRNFLKLSNQEELKFTRENLKKIEEQLKIVFIEFYRKLRHLKNYRYVMS